MIFNRKNMKKKTMRFNKKHLKYLMKTKIKEIAGNGGTKACMDKSEFSQSWEWCVEWLTKRGFDCIVSSTDEDIINIFWN